MNAKEYLQQARNLEREIKYETAKLEKMKASLYSKSPSFKNNGGKSSNYGSFDILANDAVDFENEINGKIAVLNQKRKEIELTIETVGDWLLIEVLKRHYLLYQTFPQIAENMNYCEMQVKRFHKKAMDALNMLLNVI